MAQPGRSCGVPGPGHGLDGLSDARHSSRPPVLSGELIRERQEPGLAALARSARRDVGAAIVTPWAKSAAMTIHPAEIGKQAVAGGHAVMICNGAGWHQTGQRLIVPVHITLLPLPPCPPELNPIETVWEYLRGNELCWRVWESYDDIVLACCDAGNRLIAATVRVSSITTRKQASVSI